MYAINMYDKYFSNVCKVFYMIHNVFYSAITDMLAMQDADSDQDGANSSRGKWIIIPLYQENDRLENTTHRNINRYN